MKWEDAALLRYLTDIFNSVLLKDVIKRNKIRDIDLLEKIVLYLMDTIGNTFSAKTISDFLKNQGRKLSTETVYTYLKALENAFLIHKVSRFDIKGKRLLETQEKYFVSDLGLHHATIGYRENDIGGVLENVVFLELLRRGWTIYIGKQGSSEVDFVAAKTDERLYAQVCYVLTEDTTNREFDPLQAIDDNYEKIVLSTDSLISFNRNGIKQKNIIDFCLKARGDHSWSELWVCWNFYPEFSSRTLSCISFGRFGFLSPLQYTQSQKMEILKHYPIILL
nr:ATP-binding protein [uncultured Sphaerochaeta sp.]